MPRSDTWPGGIAVETLGGMDSAGSCDSVVSVNSGFSDESLEQLSAEEQACLIFLEETIESLEADEDSGLSNDEPDLLPAPGSLAAKMAHLSSSMAHNMSKYPHDGSRREGGRGQRSIQGYLVPTPLVLAKNGPLKAAMDLPSPMFTHRSPHTIGSGPKQEATAADGKEVCKDHPKNVSTEWKGGQEGQRLDSALSRGPLSYEGLLELRKTASLRKHTPSSAPEPKERVKPPSTHIHEGGKSSHHLDTPSQPTLFSRDPKAAPPTVAPKPKKLPYSFVMRTEKAPVPSPDSSTNCLGTSPTERGVMDTEKVRREALHKLGLLRDREVVSGANPIPLYSPKSHRHQDLPDPSQIRPPPASFFPSKGGCPRSRSDLPAVHSSHPAWPVGVKSATLERSGMGLGSYVASQVRPSSHPQPRPRTTSLGDRKGLKEVQDDGTQPATTAPPTSQKPPLLNSMNVVNAHWSQPGQVRQEALRKLGLLSD
ncbi:hypothetical protein AAFF_G00243360 [Aldrovandia affinis]|uniref:Specifically androgen-regulated gene protein n=1 Tax=Aldrovandia affinis TaxID=143900 RepID=A0AAD7REA3_9TELE|nr:hypothetical protein AAFF_G00243360 [Aldrovandia affinis]